MGKWRAKAQKHTSQHGTQTCAHTRANCVTWWQSQYFSPHGVVVMRRPFSRSLDARRSLAMEHDDVLIPTDILRTPPNITWWLTLWPWTALRQIWGFIMWRYHGNAPLAIKHVVAVTPMDTVRSFLSQLKGKLSKLVSFPQKPLPWQHIPRR